LVVYLLKCTQYLTFMNKLKLHNLGDVTNEPLLTQRPQNRLSLLQGL